MAGVIVLPIITSLAAGIQMFYSAAGWTQGVTTESQSNEYPPPLTKEQHRNLPRTSTKRLPQGVAYDKFRRDPYNRHYYQQPNPDVKCIDHEAVLPAGFEDQYKRLITKRFNVRHLGGTGRVWMLDPNLKVAFQNPPRIQLPSSNIIPEQCHYKELQGVQLRSNTQVLRHLDG